MDLFDQHLAKITEEEAPLAVRMGPRTLENLLGFEHIIGQGRLLRRAISLDQLSSLIFSGPPGTGKTTLPGFLTTSQSLRSRARGGVMSNK